MQHSPTTMKARPATEEEVRSAELLFGELDLPEQALSRIAELSDRAEETFRRPGGWAALIDHDGTALLVVSHDERWSFACPADTDEADAMQAARKLHGVIASQAEGWDLDR